jgi:hypothetical protein
MRTITIHISADRTYAQLLAIEATKIEFIDFDFSVEFERDFIFEDAITGWVNRFQKTRGDKIITKESRIEFNKNLEEQMKRLPPYWYTDEQAEKWDKEYDKRVKKEAQEQLRKSNDKCVVCGATIQQAKKGKIRHTCSDKCRQESYRLRKKNIQVL